MPVSTARFANVAFSNGSLPQGFLDRINKGQPISAPSDYNMSSLISGGYHTIKLPTPIEVHSGDNVIIAITYNTRVPLSWAYERTNITKNLITKPGQAYYYNGEWHDLYPYNRDIVGCIRAYLT